MTRQTRDTDGKSRLRIEIRIVYVLRDEKHRPTFLGLVSELSSAARALMEFVGASESSYSLMEQQERKGRFVELFQFATEHERSRFDDLYCQDRKIATIQGLIDEFVDAAHSDYVVIPAVISPNSLSAVVA
jgi:hypothetical protein